MRPRDRARVVHVVVAGELGGAERVTLDLARHTGDDAEHCIALVTSKREVVSAFSKSHVRIHDPGPSGDHAAAYLWRSIGPCYVSWLAGVMARERATIAHLHTFGSHVLGTRAALRAGAAILRTEHSSRVYTTPSCWPFSRWSLARSDAVVAISDYIRRTVLSRAPGVAGRIHIVGNGVDTSRFAPIARRASGGRPFSFVLLARLEPRKGIDLALQSFAQVPGATLDIIGDGAEKERLGRLASELGLRGRVHFHGFLDDPRPVMSTADAAISSSSDEGLGLGLLECMAVGLPVVAVPRGGIPEIVRDGVTGWLSAERSVESLAGVMRAAASSLPRAREIGDRARRFVEQRHSIRAMVESYGRIYSTLHASRASKRERGTA